MTVIGGRTVELKQEKSQEVLFSIEKIYIKDISYEAPSVPGAFSRKIKNKEVNVQLDVAHNLLSAEQSLYEVVLMVTTTATSEGKNLFLVEIKQAGLFRITGLEGENLKKSLEISCPNILLPFARESLNDFVTRGGFSQLLIGPINFETYYSQKPATDQPKAQA